MAASWRPARRVISHVHLACLLLSCLGLSGGISASIAQTDLAPAPEKRMQAKKEPRTGRWDILEAEKLVLSYNYQTNEPGDLLARIQPDNRKYARARGDYIHPLYGLDGEVLTKDWSVDHPHHRGIYWAWPEVDYGGQRGDLHALQKVFARPTGSCVGESGPESASIDAENLWLWDDQEPIVKERALIRAWRANAAGRWVDLEFRFTALKDPVSLARRGTQHYGGLNIRLSAVQGQSIRCATNAAGASDPKAWAELSGTFAGGAQPSALTILQSPGNPGYPGDWVKYPELNWLQPTFPTAGTRHVLAKGQTLVLKYRLWIHRGTASDAGVEAAWGEWTKALKSATAN